MTARRHRRPLERAHRGLERAAQLLHGRTTTGTLQQADNHTNAAIHNLQLAIDSSAYNNTQTIIMESARSAALQAAARIDTVQEDLEQTYLAHDGSPPPQRVQEILTATASEAHRMVGDAIYIMDAGELGTTSTSPMQRALRPVNAAAALTCIALIVALAVFDGRAVSIAGIVVSMVAILAIMAHGVYKWDLIGPRELDHHLMAILACIIVMTAAVFTLGAGLRVTTLTALTMSITTASFWAIMRIVR